MINRRGMIGALAGSAAVAKSPTLDMKKPKQCYSALAYTDILRAWTSEYVRKKSGLGTNCYVFPCTSGRKEPGKNYEFKTTYSAFQYDLPHGEQERWVELCGVRHSEVMEAFASACLNGEAPGVWWE